MKNKLTDLNDHLFAQLERLGDEELTNEQLEKEASRTDAIVQVSEQIINNAQLALDAAEMMAKNGNGAWSSMLPLIEGKPTPPPAQKVPDYSGQGKINGKA